MRHTWAYTGGFLWGIGMGMGGRQGMRVHPSFRWNPPLQNSTSSYSVLLKRPAHACLVEFQVNVFSPSFYQKGCKFTDLTPSPFLTSAAIQWAPDKYALGAGLCQVPMGAQCERGRHSVFRLEAQMLVRRPCMLQRSLEFCGSALA